MLLIILINKIFFNYPHSQKSLRFKSRERDDQIVGNARLIALSLMKCCRRNWCTQIPMCGGAPSRIKVIESRHCRCCTWNTRKFSSMFWKLLPVTGPWQAASSKRKGPRMNMPLNSRQTVVFDECSGIFWKVWGFSMSQMRQLWMLTVPFKWKCAPSLYRIYHVYDAFISTLARNFSAKISRFSQLVISNCWF